jgi:hypothetical protein
VTDPLLRALGADPRVFRPVYRAQKLMLGRRARLLQGRRKTGSSFRMLCLFAFVYGLTSASMALVASPLLGAGLALTLPSAFLLTIALTDNAEVLVHPGEHLVLAAHPHDERSILLAKLAAVARSLAVLSAFLFVPAAIALSFFGRSPWAGLAFLAGAAGDGLAVSTAGMLVAVLLVRSGGRRAMDRLLPWAQGVFQIGYLLAITGNRFLHTNRPPGRAFAFLSWLLPPFWFAAPFELATGGSRAAWGRLALALGSLVLLLWGGGRLAVGLGRSLLEPETRAAARRPAPAPAARSSSGLLSRLLRFEGLRLLALLRIHLRSDWRTRSEVLSLPLTGLFIILVYSGSSGPLGGWSIPFIYGWLLLVSADTLTRSQRPESLWWLLSSPIDRTRFSLSTIPLLRFLLLLPLSVAVAFRDRNFGFQAAGAWPQKLLWLVALVVYGDLLLVAGKIVFPEFPFSQPSRREGGAAGGRMLVILSGSLVSGLGTALFLVSQRFLPSSVLWVLASLLLLHLPAAVWARRRAARAAAGLELVALG